MTGLATGDPVQILVGLHASKRGTIHSLDGEGFWVLPDGVTTPALYEVFELAPDLQAIGAETIAEYAPEDDGTEAEALAHVEVPRRSSSQAGLAAIRYGVVA